MSDEKRGLESGALSQFSDWFQSEFGPGRFVFDQFLAPPMPDALCFLDGEPVHVEIAHFYGTESDARLLLGRIGKSAPTPRERRESAMVPLDNRLLVPLNRLLRQKPDKHHAGILGGLVVNPLQHFLFAMLLNIFPGIKLDSEFRAVIPSNRSGCSVRAASFTRSVANCIASSARKASTYPRYSIANGQRQRTRRNRYHHRGEWYQLALHEAQEA